MEVTPLQVFDCELSGTSLVEASAGTGKTWNICALYLRLLLERRLEVTQILVVSFTKAATAELRERIRDRIVETLRHLAEPAAAAADPFAGPLFAMIGARGMAPGEVRLRLEAALQTFDEAAIFTLHGFCERALRDVPFSAGMPLQMEVVADDAMLCLEVASDFWRRHVAAARLPPGLVGLLLGQHDSPQRLAEFLQHHLARPLARAEWPAGIDRPVAVDSARVQRAYDAARATWLGGRAQILAIMADALPRLFANIHNRKSVATAVASWDALFATGDPFADGDALEKLDLLAQARLKPKKNQAPPASHPFFDEAQALLDARAAAAQALTLCRLQLLHALLAEAVPALRKLKLARRVMDFDDILYNLYERVAGGAWPWLAGHLRQRFPAALIDEFQDTDPLQYAIFRAIYHDTDAPLFLVGDPKQAIYSFRRADLHVYLRARREAQRIHTLTANQRCTEPLLHGINALFGAQRGAFVLEDIHYRPLQYGHKTRPAFVDRSAARASLQLWALPGGADGGVLTKGQARQRAALATAAEIARLLSAAGAGEVTLDGRALGAGDIAVLVRTHDEGQLVRQALADLGLGSVERSLASVFAAPEAGELERLLAAIVDPGRTSLMHAALATVLLGGTAERVVALAADPDEALDWTERLADYRDEWLRRGVGVMLRRLLVEQRVAPRLLRLAQGERRLTNLLHLIERVQSADQSPASPDLVLRWLRARIAAPDADEATQLRLETDRHLVQITTIHQAKGLEFPVTFCPFLWDGSRGRAPDSRNGREYHAGDGTLVVDFRPLDADDAGKAALARIRAQQDLDRRAERMRLIYVALTRAVQRCYLVVGSYLHRRTEKEAAGALLPSLVGEEGWSAFAARLAPAVGITSLPQGGVARGSPGAATLAPLRPIPQPPHIPAGWRLGSYSQLVHASAGESAAVDHDLRATAAADLALPEEVPADDILRFPRGMTAGHCIHTVLETVDFTEPQGWDAAIAAALRRYPQVPRPGSSAGLLPQMLGAMVRDVVATPLPGGFSLHAVPRSRRLVELRFLMPATRLTVQALRQLLGRHGMPMPALSFPALQGYLEGAIDLVCEAAGRYWIIDWKSNYLGGAAASYRAAALAGAMDRHQYHLQYLLYTVALHRYLRTRLPDYSYDAHIGGALYLFVRGVRPDWCRAGEPHAGVFAQRPAAALVEALSALLDDARNAA
jgi:exodeoxyribonuclease V beta subunit